MVLRQNCLRKCRRQQQGGPASDEKKKYSVGEYADAGSSISSQIQDQFSLLVKRHLNLPDYATPW